MPRVDANHSSNSSAGVDKPSVDTCISSMRGTRMYHVSVRRVSSSPYMHASAVRMFRGFWLGLQR